MLCKIIDRYINVFFDVIQMKKENWESVFWTPQFGPPDRYIGLPNGLDASLRTHSHNQKIGKMG